MIVWLLIAVIILLVVAIVVLLCSNRTPACEHQWQRDLAPTVKQRLIPFDYHHQYDGLPDHDVVETKTIHQAYCGKCGEMRVEHVEYHTINATNYKGDLSQVSIT